MSVSSAANFLHPTASVHSRKSSAHSRHGEWIEWPFSSQAYDPAVDNGSDILAAFEQFEAEELSEQVTAVKQFSWQQAACVPSEKVLDLKGLAVSLQENADVSQRYYFINRFLKKSNVVQMPSGARRLQICSPALKLMISTLGVPPAFLGALARFFQPAGRGSRCYKSQANTHIHDQWYIIPVRVQVSCTETQRSHVSGHSGSNQMNPLHYLHLPDEKLDIRGSQIGIWFQSDMTRQQSTAVVISLQDGRWSRIVEEPQKRIWEVLEHHRRAETQPQGFDIHLVYLTSALRLWKNVLDSFNSQLLAHEKKLQDSMEYLGEQEQDLTNRLNKILHTMTAHLHRYGSELSNLSDIVAHVRKQYDFIRNYTSKVSAPTDGDLPVQQHHGPDRTQSAINQIQSQLEDVMIFRLELERKTENILALLFNNIKVSNDKVMVANGNKMNQMLLASRTEARMSMQLAEEMRNDSAAMKTIALLTAFFLPGTSFAALLAMPFFAQNVWMNDASKIWLWIALTVPSTLLAFAFYHYWSKRHKSQMTQSSASGIAELGQLLSTSTK